jgi:hypothetical protein
MRSLIITARQSLAALASVHDRGHLGISAVKTLRGSCRFILLEFWCEEQARPLVVEPEFYRASRRHPQADRS